jgi:hypothetical protein
MQKEKMHLWFQVAFTVDIGPDPVTGKRKQKTKSGFKTKEEAETAATALIHELNQGML